MSAENLRTFLAAADRILPGGEGPGALEVGIGEFVERASKYPPVAVLADTLGHGLSLLRSMARERFDRDFASCNAEQRDDILGRVQRIPHPTLQRFFVMLVDLTLAGFLCDPVHGGNQDRRGWHYLGVDFERQPGPASGE